MHKKFDHKEIEAKWQEQWKASGIYNVGDRDTEKEKEYVLVEWPYPSGNLHIGHWYAFAVPDIYVRFQRMEGKQVLFPIGFDAFGLPAENAAIKRNLDPKAWTNENIAYMKTQLASMGNAFSWDTTTSSTDPEYYKWTQWMFTQFFENDIAYRGKGIVNWCPSCNTVLANEQVLNDDTCERCGSSVEKKEMDEWKLRITNYADRLIDDLEPLDWPAHIKEAQRQWIGRSEGALIDFQISTKSKPNFLILHGYTGHIDRNFLPWIKKELESQGCSVQTPQLPNTDNPSEDEQVSYVIENCDIDENTVIVGHSLGAIVAMRVVERLEQDVRSLVLVAAALSPDFSDTEKSYHQSFSWEFDYGEIKKKAGQITILSDLQETKRISYLESLATTLNAKLVTGNAAIEHFTGIQEPLILENIQPSVQVFTTRPDTLYGATYMVLAPEHELVEINKGNIANWDEVSEYISSSKKKAEQDRLDATKEKTGVELKGITATNPANGVEVPVFIADYVLSNYGTGAIMAVPAHDERDNAFAQKFELPIKKVVDTKKYLVFDFDGVLGDTFESSVKAQVAMGRFPDIETAHADVLRYSRNKPHHTRDHSMTEKDLAEEYDWIKRYGEEMQHADFKLFDEFIDEVEKVQNTRIGVVSSGSELYVKPAIEKTKLFPTHIFAFEQHHSKEEKIELICKDWGIPVEDVYYFTDTKADVLELQGLIPKDHIIGCAWGYLGEEELAELLPHEQILTDASDIHRIFEDIHTDPGFLIGSGEFDGMDSEEAKKAITKKVGGRMTNTYKLRDWSIGRQRYWGVPIPIVYDPEGRPHVIPAEYLPWILPEDVDFRPTGEPPLAKSKELKERTEKLFGKGWIPEVETMDTFVDSSWYFLRYLDNKNDDELSSKAVQKEWMPIDVYFGGAEHTTMHLLYSRFWQKALFDLKLVEHTEPYTKRVNRGLILGPDGNKMSKSKGNVIDPDEQVSRVGADTVKMYLSFMGPYGEVTSYPWDMGGIAGLRRFLERVYGLRDHVAEKESEEVTRLLHKTIKKVRDDVAAFKFNTAISALMIFTNTAEKQGLCEESYRIFLTLLAPFAPHLTEELWHMTGEKNSIHTQTYPFYDAELTADELVTIGVQINGKVRGSITVVPNATEDAARAAAEADVVLAARMAEGKIQKVIYVPGRILNIIIG